jgi:hypothetical protein
MSQSTTLTAGTSTTPTTSIKSFERNDEDDIPSGFIYIETTMSTIVSTTVSTTVSTIVSTTMTTKRKTSNLLTTNQVTISLRNIPTTKR